MPAVEKLGERVAAHSERIKALLLLVVIADHNDWFRLLAPDLFRPLTFHVLGFILLACGFAREGLSKRFVADRAARYLVPFWWVLSGAAAVYYLLLHGHPDAAAAALAWAKAAAIGNAPQVKTASGLLMLWFLPCLFGLVCLLAAYQSLAPGLARRLALIGAIAAHLALPLLPSALLLQIPFGLAIAAELFILGLLWRRLLACALPRGWGLLAAAALVASYGWLVLTRTHLEIATFDLAGIEAPWLLLLQDAAGLAGVLSVVWLASVLPNWRWLDALGRRSLLVYLLHPAAYVVLVRLLPFPPSAGAQLGIGLAAALAATAAAYGMAALLAAPPAAAWITPRGWADWPPTRWLANQR